MTFNQKFASLLLIASVGASVCSTAALAESAPSLPLTMEEIKAKRKEARENVMVPSLGGIRGIAYRVVGYKDFEPLENELGKILKETGVPLHVATKLKPGDNPVDAILQITFYKTASHTVADLSVTQWVSLMRDPKTQIKAVTYSDKVWLSSHNPKEAIAQLGNDFVHDFLKANARSTARSSRKANREASDRRDSKESKSKKSSKK
ncbi:MAG: hypothetical protein IT343_17370 [Candidatus Melainabacteria bacterium]|jgi:hypothetical protein|nr:hypothetical protein [Candidatus Melainabacteria bacterium]